MKVLLVCCLIFGLTQATPPFSDGLAGITSIVGDLAGGALGIVRFFRDSTERFNGGGDSDLSTNGEVVDGHGGGIPAQSGVQSFGGSGSAAGSSSYSAPPQQGHGSAGGYSYNPPPPPQQNYGAPQQSFSAVAPQQNYAPPQQSYGAPQQSFSAVAPQQNYAPPQQNYGPPATIQQGVAANGGYDYTPKQSFSAVAPQNNYAPPPPPGNSYLPPNGGHASGGTGAGSHSESGSESGHESEGEGEESEGGSSFDIGSVLKFKTGLLEQGRAASNRHWDRKSSGLNSVFGLLSGLGGGGGSDDSNAESESSSHGESGNSESLPYF